MSSPNRILVAAADPIDSTHSVSVSNETSAIFAAASASKRNLILEAIVPATIDRIELSAIDQPADLLHIAAHGNDSYLELENVSSETSRHKYQSVASALARTGAKLIFLNGCETERIGHALTRLCPAWVVCTTGFLPEEIATSFVDLFYTRVLATCDIQRSFDASQEHLKDKHPHVPYYLFPGKPSLEIEPGTLNVHRSFLQVRSRAEAGKILGRRLELLRLFPFMRGPSAPVLWVRGAPLAGVSTYLRAAVARYEWMFARPPIQVDLRLPTSIRSIEKQFARTVGAEQIVSIQESLMAQATLLSVDHFDSAADPSAARDILAAVSILPNGCPSRVLIGSGLLSRPSREYEELVLSELSEPDALLLLAQGIGDERAARLRGLLREMPRLPGRLMTLINDVHNGADDAHLRELLTNGDPRAGLDRLADHYYSVPESRLLMVCLAQVGTFASRSAIAAGFNAGAGNELLGANDAFERTISWLREARMLWVEEIQSTPGALPEAYFHVLPDFLHVVRQRLVESPPLERVDCLEAIANFALHKAQRGELNPRSDPPWVGEVAQRCCEAGRTAIVAELGRVLLSRKGLFRLSSGSGEIELLARATLRASREQGDNDNACHLSLVLGETYYRSGRLDEAEEVFRQCMSLEALPERRLQLFRALGQIAYRKGRYEEALSLCDEANLHASSAKNDYVMTLLHQRSKVLFRLGRLDEALAGFQTVVTSRAASDDFRSMIKAQHEIAKIIHSRGQLEDAERQYLVVLAGAEAEGFRNFLPAPIYQLVLVNLSKPDIEQAAGYHERLAKIAHSIRDPLWLTLCELAGGMIEFDRGRVVDATRMITQAVQAARDHGLAQIERDAKNWIKDRALRESSKSSGLAAASLATLGGLDPKKTEKALRYSHERERVKKIELQFTSDHATRVLQWSAGSWSCTCDHFSKVGRCSHLLALSVMESLGWRLFSD